MTEDAVPTLLPASLQIPSSPGEGLGNYSHSRPIPGTIEARGLATWEFPHDSGLGPRSRRAPAKRSAASYLRSVSEAP